MAPFLFSLARPAPSPRRVDGARSHDHRTVAGLPTFCPAERERQRARCKEEEAQNRTLEVAAAHRHPQAPRGHVRVHIHVHRTGCAPGVHTCERRGAPGDHIADVDCRAPATTPRGGGRGSARPRQPRPQPPSHGRLYGAGGRPHGPTGRRRWRSSQRAVRAFQRQGQVEAKAGAAPGQSPRHRPEQVGNQSGAPRLLAARKAVPTHGPPPARGGHARQLGQRRPLWEEGERVVQPSDQSLQLSADRRGASSPANVMPPHAGNRQGQPGRLFRRGRRQFRGFHVRPLRAQRRGRLRRLPRSRLGAARP